VSDPNEIPERLVFAEADKAGSAYLRSALLAVVAHFKGDPRAPFRDQPKDIHDAFFHGVSATIKFRQGMYAYKGPWQGAIPWLRERLEETPSEKFRLALEEMVSPVTCAECGGRRLRPDSLAVRVGARGIADYTGMTIEDAITAFDQVKL